MGRFETEYNKLNAQQKQAVDTIDGPLLVVAGPGTGKTQLLSVRVANILKNRDVSPGNILCLTFTNKAATNMQDRLQDILGGSGYGVAVKTFHSFAAELMNQYPQYFWSGARLAIAPEAVQLHTIETIQRRLPHDNPLASRFGGRFTGTEQIREAIKLTKEAGLTPEKLRAIINVNLAYIDTIESRLTDILSPALSYKRLPELAEQIAGLPKQTIDDKVSPLLSMSTVLEEGLNFAISRDEGTNKTQYTGDWKKQWLQTEEGQKGMFKERRKNNWWLELVDVYESYRDMLHGRGYYDYADMILEVIAQLEQHAALRASVQERYQYILIDEFQDTNAAQLRLAQLVATNAENDKPNLMAVGDDDQSIFKFNGAELNNMLHFQRSFSGTKIVVLTKNYRSSQAVLNTAKRVIEQSSDRLVKRQPKLSKNLSAAKPPKTKGRITHLSYPSREHQLSLAARDIAEAWKTKPNGLAVLARNHDSLVRMSSVLVQLGLPIRYERSNDVLQHEAVMQICLLAEIIVAIYKGDESAVNVRLSDSLRHPMWKLSNKQLWAIALANASQPHWLDYLRSSKDKHLSSLAHWLEELARSAKTMPLALMMEYLLGLRPYVSFTSPVREYFTSRRQANDDYLRTLSALQLLRTLSDEFAYGAEAHLTDFVSLITLHRDKGRIISDESAFVTDDSAIYLSTVHKAKGLEFDTVYILDAVESEWRPRSNAHASPINLPLRPHGDDLDDYARLMYVATTRARHSIIATSYSKDTSGEEVLTTPFIRFSIPDTTAKRSSGRQQDIAVLEEQLAWPRLDIQDEKQALKASLETYSMSVTHLINFLDLTKGGPNYFFERNILRLPEAKSATLAHGTAGHDALEEAQKLINKGAFNLAKVQKTYQSSLAHQALPADEYNQYLGKGKAMLKRLFTTYSYKLPKGSLPEQLISDVHLGEARLNGKLDRVDISSDDSLVVVDYKTGTALPSFSTRSKALARKVWQHRLQLVFYALLMKHSPRWQKYKGVLAQMVYLEAQSAKSLVLDYAPTNEEVNRLEKLIAAVWQRIMKLDFPDTSSYSADITGIEAFENDLLNEVI